MRDLVFPCAQCGKPLTVPEDLAGRETACQACRHKMNVPWIFPCEFCSEPVTASVEQVGTEVECPACRRTTAVPRPRAHLTLKGREKTVRGAASASSRSENLSQLADTKAFEPVRSDQRTRQSRIALLRFGLVFTGLIVSLLVVGGLVASHFRGKAQAKRAAAAEEADRSERLARERRLRSEGYNLANRAVQQSPRWALTRPNAELLWIALNDWKPTANEARAAFDTLVGADAATHGRYSATLEAVLTPVDIDNGGDRLLGFALGFSGDGAEVRALPVFHEAAVRKLVLASRK